MGDARELGACSYSQRDHERAKLRQGPASSPVRAKGTPADDTVKRISEATKCGRSAADVTAQTFQTIAEQHPIFTALAAQGLAWAALFLWT